MSEAVREDVLAEVLDGLRAVGDEARRDFGALGPAQLNWKPAPERWSVAQIFEHLSKTNESYLPLLGEVARGERRPTAWERYSPLSGFWGRFLVKALQPESARKLRTTAKFEPSRSDIDAGVVARFAETQRRLAESVEATRALDPRRVVVTSPFNGLVTYSLLDACRGMVAHGRRHLAQARAVVGAEGFPRA